MAKATTGAMGSVGVEGNGLQGSDLKADMWLFLTSTSLCFLLYFFFPLSYRLPNIFLLFFSCPNLPDIRSFTISAVEIDIGFEQQVLFIAKTQFKSKFIYIKPQRNLQPCGVNEY